MFGSGNMMGADPQRMRETQLTSVTNKYPNMRFVNPDRSMLDVPLLLSNNAQLIFRVFLPPGFPNQAPQIAVLATAQHQYLDMHCMVQHPKLQKWSPQLKLGDVLGEIFGAFYTSPPRITSYTPPQSQQAAFAPGSQKLSTVNPGMMQQPPYMVGTPQQSNPYYQQQQQQMGMNTGVLLPSTGTINQQMSPQMSPQSQSPQSQSQGQSPQYQRQQSHIQMPPLPNDFPQLASLTVGELEKLLENNCENDKFREFFDNLEAVKNIQALKIELEKGNTQCAEKNLEYEKTIQTLSKEVDELQRVLAQKKDLFDEKARRQQEIMQLYAPRNLLNKLNEATLAAENNSELTAEEFIRAQNPNVKSFIDRYLQERTLFYLRKNKKERFAKSLNLY